MQLSNLDLARRAIKLYSSDMAPKAVNRYNQRSWIASIAALGDRWLLAKPQKKQVQS